METVPSVIWLQYHGDQEPEPCEIVSARDVTWSANKEFASDIGPYVLRDELERENARLRVESIKLTQLLRDLLAQADYVHHFSSWDTMCEYNADPDARAAARKYLSAEREQSSTSHGGHK